MTPEQFLDALLSLPGLVPPKISPDGRYAAWTWYRVGPAADVFVAPTDGAAPPVRLTETPNNTFVVSWTPDSKAVIVEEDQSGDERVRLFRIGINQPGVMVPLTEPSPKYFLRGGQLHPNGRWLIYAANFDINTHKEIEPTWVYHHDLETGERKVLARPQKGGYYVPELNKQGTHILYTRNDLHPAGKQIWLVDIEGREDREILNFGPSVKVVASWFPDGQRVLFLAEAGTYRRLGVWDLEGDAIRWLIDDPARNIEHAFVPHGSEQAVVVEMKEARVCASLLDVERGEEFFIPQIPGNLIPLAPVGIGEWVGQYYRSRQPSDLVRFSPKNLQHASFASLTRIWERTTLRPQDLTPAEDLRWQSVDGLEIQGWLYRAKRLKGTVIYIHGGPTFHSEDRLNVQIQFLVSQGFNVLDPNYRGSTGFGLAFQEAIKVHGWGGFE